MVDVDPNWINASAGAPAYTAAELRRNDAVLLYGGVADRLGARQGVRPGAQAVTLAGTTVTVHDVPVVVYPGITSISGPYRAALLSTTHALNAADATNPRKDIICIQVEDHDEDASGQRRARSVYVVGTPAPSPVDPAVPAGAYKAASVTVPQSGGGSPTLSYLAPWTVAAGGVLPVRNDAELPNGTSGLYDGAVRWKQDTNELQVYSGTAWETVGQRILIPPVSAVRTTSLSVGTSEVEVLAAPAITGNGSTKVKVTIKWWGWTTAVSGTSNMSLRLKRGATIIDRIAINVIDSSVHAGGEFSFVDTPPAGSQTYSFACVRGSGSAGSQIEGSATGVISIRVEQFTP